MEQRIYHGSFTAQTLAGCLVSFFDHGNLKVQVLGENPTVLVQIATDENSSSGGKTALSILLQNVADGVAVKVGQQNWLGIAASMGFTAISTLRNPFNLLWRIDDLAQDLENMQLTDQVWNTLDENARILGTGFELTDRLKRFRCDYCDVANPAGEPTCIACGAPMEHNQPITCKNCGFVILKNETICPNCKKTIN
jgi:hypothetical protein